MIWGIPKSKGGIVIRKAFYFFLCILFLMAIMAACAKTPQETEVVATPTVQSIETAVIPTPTQEPWHLLILSDSSGWGLAKAYASQIEKNVGVKIVVEDYAVPDLSVGQVINALKQEGTIRGDLSGLSAAISDADVIVLYGNPRDSVIPENPGDVEGCLYDIGLPPKICNPASFEKYITDLKWVWGEIFRLRNGKPTILRAIDFPNPWISTWYETDTYLACTRCWENGSNAVRLAAEAYHIPFLSRYDAYNGVNHDEDPREKGYIRSDGNHPNTLGAQVIAELLAQMGYEPVPPP
jgi:hypothetical protein